MPTESCITDPSKGEPTGVTKNGVFKNEKNTSLGNSLFQIAAILSIAWDNNYIATFPKIKQFYDSPLKYRGFKNDNIFRKLNTYSVKISKKINLNHTWHNIKNLLCDKIEINSFFQSYKYFHKYRDNILDIFSIDEKSLNYIKKKYNDILFENQINVSIHIRRGDFVTIAETWNKEYLLKDTYYTNALNYIDNKLKNQKYNLLIFSDDIDYCKNKLNFNKENRNIYYIENNLDYMDLWIMSLCTHNIINKSTFSWWGAYLNKNDDKIIIAPKKSIFCEKKQKDIWVKQLYFPDWIILDE